MTVRGASDRGAGSPSAAQAVSLPRRAGPWVRGPLWDGVWMLGALWLAPLVLFLSRGHDDPEKSPADTLYFALTALFWIAHRVGSTWLAYATTAYRPLLRAQPVRFVAMPALVTVACFALFLPPDGALPWTRMQRVTYLAIADYGLSSYHFAAQHFGALCLYRVRGGRAAAPVTRRLDRWFALAVVGGLVFAAEVIAGTVAYQGKWIDRWIDPAWVRATQGALKTGGTALLAVATLGLLALEARPGARSLPRALYVLSVASMVALALHGRSPFLFIAVWSTQHWMLATGLSTLVARAEPAPAGTTWRRAVHPVNRRGWALLVVLAAFSVLSLPLFEVESNVDGGTYYGDRIFGAFAAALRTSSWVPPLIALGFATAFVHYLLDRAAFRFSDPRVREAARGLLEPRVTGPS